MERLLPKYKQFNIIGHSFGATIAVEIAKKLEQNGQKVQLIAVDGSMTLIKKYLEGLVRGAEIAKLSLPELIIHQIAFEILPNVAKAEVVRELSKLKDSEDQIKKALSLSGIQKYSKEFLTKSFKGMINRLQAIGKATDEPTEPKLNANILLIRAKTGLLHDIEEDYGLDRVTNGEVAIHCSDETHFTLLEDQQVLDIIMDRCLRKC